MALRTRARRRPTVSGAPSSNSAVGTPNLCSNSNSSSTIAIESSPRPPAPSRKSSGNGPLPARGQRERSRSTTASSIRVAAGMTGEAYQPASRRSFKTSLTRQNPVRHRAQNLLQRGGSGTGFFEGVVEQRLHPLLAGGGADAVDGRAVGDEV